MYCPRMSKTEFMGEREIENLEKKTSFIRRNTTRRQPTSILEVGRRSLLYARQLLEYTLEPSFRKSGPTQNSTDVVGDGVGWGSKSRWIIVCDSVLISRFEERLRTGKSSIQYYLKTTNWSQSPIQQRVGDFNTWSSSYDRELVETVFNCEQSVPV